MALSRQQLRYQAAVARYKAGKQKPPTRAQAKAWLKPIRDSFAQMRSGYVDAIQGYAVTRLHNDDEYVRIDFCINGFAAIIERLMPDLSAEVMHQVSQKLANKMPLTEDEIDSCSALLNACEDRLIKLPRKTLLDASMAEQVAIEFERLGLQEAA